MPVGSTSQRSVQILGFEDCGLLTPLHRLVSASCSSGQHFASGFLQIRSRPRDPCLWLILPLAGCVEGFHLQVTCLATTAKRVALTRNAPCLAHRKKRHPTGAFSICLRSSRSDPLAPSLMTLGSESDRLDLSSLLQRNQLSLLPKMPGGLCWYPVTTNARLQSSDTTLPEEASSFNPMR